MPGIEQMLRSFGKYKHKNWFRNRVINVGVDVIRLS